mmetsp:Transcript_23433/g.49980  ORF Transcript_23433/g.49980 Transcript_23433/m.49980 type:complete len:308 (+) Transcript_23433:171-1094(+)
MGLATFKIPTYTFSRDRPKENDWTSLLLLVLLLLFTSLLGVYMFSMPFLSWFFNDYMGQGARLCTADPYEMVCFNGADYIELAKSLGRYTSEGKLWACGCEQGILSDWACAIDPGARYSLSLFISTAPGTGAMAALSSWPITAMWLYGSGTIKTNRFLIRLSLIVFQFFYGCFLIDTGCINQELHTQVVHYFLVAEGVHYALVAWSLGCCCNSRAATFIIGIGICGYAILIVGLLIDGGLLKGVVSQWVEDHAFWLAECLGLLMTFSIAPILLIFQEEDDDDDDVMDDGEAKELELGTSAAVPMLLQ